MASTSASNITRRSMPRPIPDVGGRPYSRARTNAQVGGVGFEIAVRGGVRLVLESLLLLLGDVELAVAVGQLLAVDRQLEPVGQCRIVFGAPGQRGDLDREPADEDRVHHGGQEDPVVELEDELARAPFG